VLLLLLGYKESVKGTFNILLPLRIYNKSYRKRSKKGIEIR
jgi:hypothetical protein